MSKPTPTSIISRSDPRENLLPGAAAASKGRPWSRKVWEQFLRISANTWWPEATSVLFSILCSVAIGTTLQMFSGKPMPDLPRGVTLNAVISVLATTCKSLLLFVVGSCLSQLKWVWFQSKRPLAQLQILEDAARGPLGAILLIVDRLVLSVASVGALVTILALAFDPFVQQVLVYPLVPVPFDSASSLTKQALAFFTLPTDEIRLNRAIQEGIWSTEFQQNPSCVSGNCTWEVFKSVAWCHKCEPVHVTDAGTCDVTFTQQDLWGNLSGNSTEEPADVDRTCEFQLDGGVIGELDVTATSYWRSGDYWTVNVEWDEHLVWPGSNTFIGIDNPLLSFGLASVAYDEDKNSIYVNESRVCALDFCLQEYNVSVTDGRPSVIEQGRSFGTKFSLPSWNKTEPDNVTYYCWGATQHDERQFQSRYIENSGGLNEGLNTVYFDAEDFAFCIPGGRSTSDGSFMPSTLWTWGTSIASLLSDSRRVYVPSPSDCLVSSSEACPPQYDERQNKTSSDFYDQMMALGADQTFENIAKSLSKLALDESWETVSGQAISMLPFVTVRWYWLTLPALLNLLVLLFLVLTMIATREQKAPLWKSSTLALLFHGLEDDEIRISNAETVSEMNQAAEHTTVRLRRSDRSEVILLGD
ncbi:hypothetical protein OHC33_000325 [Knufia fluminis]|uniref:PI-PLC Y-box domain-containing protein n=1 Tax=Knufia fluminis TaxID=191047 RepID=A0AAN8ETJ6_9EURO|nr:hypothetical protein OHC33_000325 [Knufia fluminis]